MSELKKLLIDMQFYSWKRLIIFFLDPALIAIINFRISGFLFRVKGGRFFYYFYWPFWRLISNITGIEISGRTKIGEGFRIFHYGGIFINENAVIGKNCILYNDVVIGSKDYIGGNAPSIGDNVCIGTGAKVLGDIKIGDNTNIGALTLVIKSFPEGNCTIVGIPGKKISKN